MKEVYPNLFVGGDQHLMEFADKAAKLLTEQHPHGIISSWISGYYLHAAKEPFHRQILGYKTRGAPKDHPDYLFVRTKGALTLNLVDVPDSKAKHIPDQILDEAVEYIRWCVHEEFKPVFVHCNQGWSRGPSLALLFLVEHTHFADGLSKFESVEDKFKTLYPDYQPNGIRLKVKERFERRNKDEN